MQRKREENVRSSRESGGWRHRSPRYAPGAEIDAPLPRGLHEALRGRSDAITTTTMTSEPPPSTSTSSGEDDKGFQSWRRRFSLITGLGLSEKDKAARTADALCKQCEKWKYDLLHYSQYSAVRILHLSWLYSDTMLYNTFLYHRPCGSVHVPATEAHWKQGHTRSPRMHALWRITSGRVPSDFRRNSAMPRQIHPQEAHGKHNRA